MTENNVSHKSTEDQNQSWPTNHVVKFFKKFNAYDRSKECKDKRLYDYESDIVDEELYRETQ